MMNTTRLLLILLTLAFTACEITPQEHSKLTFNTSTTASPLSDKYELQVGNAINAKWDTLFKQHLNKITTKILKPGKVVLAIRINADGKIVGLKTVSNTSSQALVDISLQSVREANLPPIPHSLLATLPNHQANINFSFTLYSAGPDRKYPKPHIPIPIY